MQSPKNNSKVVVPPTFVEQKVGDIDMARPQPEPLIMLKVPTEGSGDDASRSLIPTPSTEVRSAAIVKTEQLKEVVQLREPVPPIAQPVISVQEHSALANAKDVLEAAADLNTSVSDRQAATPSVLPEAVIKHSEKPFDSTPQKNTESLLGGKSELTKTESLIPKSEAIKAQVEPAILVDQKLGKKQVEIAQQKLVDPPVSKQEKLRLKQQELKEFIDSVERFKPDSPGTGPLAQKPVEVVAIPKAKDIETLVPQQTAPEQPLAQTANVFTLQLMVLSKQSSVDDLLKKYPEMSSGLRSIQTVANGQQRFILEYGSYPDTASANKARQSLPPEFGHALVRKIHR
jgi:DamX protein